MHVTLYICVPLNCYSSLHIHPTLVHIEVKQNNELQLYLSCYKHICANNKYAPQMPCICYICHLLHVYIWNNYISIYNSYELNAMNYVTMTTGMHIFHITGICPWKNMPATLHTCVPLHFCCSLHIDPTFLYTSIKINTLQHILTKLLQNISQQQICLSNATCPNYLMYLYGG